MFSLKSTLRVFGFAMFTGLVTLPLPAIAQTTPPKTQAPKAQNAGQGTQNFLDALWRDARAQGISRKTFDLALSGFKPDPSI
ncbi:MAG: hypothetical protein ACRDBL_03755, partial [Rhabdaerophilum sp.]